MMGLSGHNWVGDRDSTGCQHCSRCGVGGLKWDGGPCTAISDDRMYALSATNGRFEEIAAKGGHESAGATAEDDAEALLIIAKQLEDEADNISPSRGTHPAPFMRGQAAKLRAIQNLSALFPPSPVEMIALSAKVGEGDILRADATSAPVLNLRLLAAAKGVKTIVRPFIDGISKTKTPKVSSDEWLAACDELFAAIAEAETLTASSPTSAQEKE